MLFGSGLNESLYLSFGTVYVFVICCIYMFEVSTVACLLRFLLCICLLQAFARIENHCFVNKRFFPSDSSLLENVDKKRHINTTIAQVCVSFISTCCSFVWKASNLFRKINDGLVLYETTLDFLSDLILLTPYVLANSCNLISLLNFDCFCGGCIFEGVKQ